MRLIQGLQVAIEYPLKELANGVCRDVFLDLVGEDLLVGLVNLMTSSMRR